MEEWNTLNTILTIILIPLLIISTYLIITHNQQKNIIKKDLITEMNKAQKQAQQNCDNKKMKTTNIKTQDFKNYEYECYITSPYHTIPMRLTT